MTIDDNRPPTAEDQLSGSGGLRSKVSTLELEITDDGVGLPPERHSGVGLASMRERAQELGGTCSVEPAPTGGVHVEARLPLPQSPSLFLP